MPLTCPIARKAYMKEYAKRYYSENYEKCKANRDRYHTKERNDPVLWRRKLDDGKIRSKEWRKKNPDKFKAGIRRWAKTQAGRLSANASKIRSRQNHPEILLKARVRSRIGQALRKGFTKFYKSREMLGCTYVELRTHLEGLFQPGMTWENRGQWEIDHIRPCSSFDLLIPEQQKCCFHYTNLQPLWREENRKKGATWV